MLRAVVSQHICKYFRSMVLFVANYLQQIKFIRRFFDGRSH